MHFQSPRGGCSVSFLISASAASKVTEQTKKTSLQTMKIQKQVKLIDATQVTVSLGTDIQKHTWDYRLL